HAHGFAADGVDPLRMPTQSRGHGTRTKLFEGWRPCALLARTVMNILAIEARLFEFLLLLFTAFAAGAQNSLAGGGTLYTFPALMGVLHNSVWANATSTLALLPGSVAGARGFGK